MRRRKLNFKKSRKHFRRTAKKVHRLNAGHHVMRGGIRF